jgi:hypothetical protein
MLDPLVSKVFRLIKFKRRRLTQWNRNWDLHVTSSCHRIKIYSINKSRPKTAAKLAMFEKLGLPFLPITQPGEMDLEDEESYMHEMESRGGRDPKEWEQVLNTNIER